MGNNIRKAILDLSKKERAFLEKEKTEIALKAVIYEKVPEKLIGTLEYAFIKAFKLVFVQGTGLIEKTFKKEDIGLEFGANDYIIDRKDTRKNLKRMDKLSKKSNLLNNTITTASGFGMGLMGMGIPDIPVLVTTLLKGIYQIALSYGFSYEEEDEKIYILKLIKVALDSSDDRYAESEAMDTMDFQDTTLEDEINKTAKVLSDELLVEKFVQGLPIVGVIGGFVNFSVYKKVSKLAEIKYKKRYLNSKL
ncbi:MAG: EcsC family protein [Anaerovoracaceae bacterium]